MKRMAAKFVALTPRDRDEAVRKMQAQRLKELEKRQPKSIPEAVAQMKLISFYKSRLAF